MDSIKATPEITLKTKEDDMGELSDKCRVAGFYHYPSEKCYVESHLRKRGMSNDLIVLDMESMEVKAKKIKQVTGEDVTEFELSLLVFLHEYRHYAQVHHKIPLSEGGSDCITNIEVDADAFAFEKIQELIDCNPVVLEALDKYSVMEETTERRTYAV